jgi:hypothetical protein
MSATETKGVLIAVLEGLTKTCAELVLEVRALREQMAGQPGAEVGEQQTQSTSTECPDVDLFAAKPDTEAEPELPDEQGELESSPPHETPEEWLQSRGIRVNAHPQINGQDRVLLPIAVTLGEYFDDLRPLHNAIRSVQSDGRGFSVSLKNRPPETVDRCVKWANALGDRGLLLNVRYDRRTSMLTAQAQDSGLAQGFFSGRWFELYVADVLEGMLSKAGSQYGLLRNATITLADGQIRELDLFLMVDGAPLWLECKTGQYADHLERFRTLRSALGVPAERALLVVLDIPAEVAADNRALWRLSVTDQHGLAGALSEALGLPAGQSHPAVSGTSLTPGALGAMSTFRTTSREQIPPGELPSFLTKKSLRPQPEIRSTVLAAMLQVTKAGMTGADVVEVLRDEFPQLSKSRLQEVVQAAMRGGGLIGEDGDPVRALKQPLTGLVESLEDLEECCVRAYAAAVMFTDPDWFARKANQTEFRAVVNAAPPPPAQLAQIREQVVARAAAVASGTSA